MWQSAPAYDYVSRKTKAWRAGNIVRRISMVSANEFTVLADPNDLLIYCLSELSRATSIYAVHLPMFPDIPA